MINRVIRDQAKARLTEPFPEHHVLVHCGGFQFSLLRQVEDLKCSRLCLQGDDLFGPVHDRTVGLDRPPNNIIAILEINDDDFW